MSHLFIIQRNINYWRCTISFCIVLVVYNYALLLGILGTAVAQWLRCCATNRKVVGSIPDGVSEFFIDIKYFQSHYGHGAGT